IYNMLTFIRSCIAPICGASISENITPRWIFWFSSIFDVFVQILALIILSEIFAQTTSARKAES
ncbi:uncharacterized protein BDR25DRAFT_241936, partial [Lindgomyces ingoldianus]